MADEQKVDANESLANTSTEEDCVNMLEVLEEEKKLEEDANAVLGDSDDLNCTYPQGALSRQALYSCITCTKPESAPAGVCLACSLECHEGHDLYELYTKRNFTCDCGNSKFGDNKCKLVQEKKPTNENNKYNQNFCGLYCTCHRPYPDPEDTVDDHMIQCVLCEDWFHGRHLKASSPDENNYEELTCFKCVEKHPFLMHYKHLHVLSDAGETIKMSPSSTEKNITVEINNKETVNSTVTDGSDSIESRQLHAEPIKTDVLNCDNPSETVVPHHECEMPSNHKEDLVQLANNEHQPSSNIEKCLLGVFHSEEPTPCTSIYWKSEWRTELCHCPNCEKMYIDQDIPFISDLEDTIARYEVRGRIKQTSSRSQYDRGLEALSQINRVQQVEMLHGFHDLQTELKDYLKKFAENGKIVKEEDIREFFSGLASRKKPRLDMGYFCK